MTRTDFIRQYGRELILKGYAWTHDAVKLERFLASVLTTLETDHNTWDHNGDAVTAAWRALGGKGKPTLKALRALPPG